MTYIVTAQIEVDVIDEENAEFAAKYVPPNKVISFDIKSIECISEDTMEEWQGDEEHMKGKTIKLYEIECDRDCIKCGLFQSLTSGPVKIVVDTVSVKETTLFTPEFCDG